MRRRHTHRNAWLDSHNPPSDDGDEAGEIIGLFLARSSRPHPCRFLWNADDGGSLGGSASLWRLSTIERVDTLLHGY